MKCDLEKLILGLCLYALLASAVYPQSSVKSQAWQPLGGGVHGTEVKALTIFNGDLIVGGVFSDAGSVPVENVARWDGNQWHAMGTGTWTSVSQLVVFQGELIAIGSYGVASWNGNSWVALPGWSGAVDAVIVWNDKLVVGGNIFTPGHPSISRLAFWDGANWSYPDQTEILIHGAWRLTVYQNELLVGGFSELPPGGGAFNYCDLFGYDGVHWYRMDNGIPSSYNIGELGFFNGTLLVLNQAYSPTDPIQACEWHDSIWTPTTEAAFMSPDSNALPIHSLGGVSYGGLYFSWASSPVYQYPPVPSLWNGSVWYEDIPNSSCLIEYNNMLIGGLTAAEPNANVLGYRISADADGDGIFDFQDNCYLTYNPDQSDSDKDSIGDVCDPCFGCEQTVYISHIDGMYGQDTLMARTPIRMYFNLSSFADGPLNWMLMGFKMYSPDGANWAPPIYDSLPINWSQYYRYFYFSNEILGSSSIDTFGMAAVSPTGLQGFPAGFRTPYAALSTRFPRSQSGKTVCIDTSRFTANRPVGGPMLYPIYFSGDPSGSPVQVRWPGTRCFTIYDCGNTTPGNIDCDPNDQVDIADMTRMVDALYISQASFCCILV